MGIAGKQQNRYKKNGFSAGKKRFFSRFLRGHFHTFSSRSVTAIVAAYWI
jgi:hypothetical protein